MKQLNLSYPECVKMMGNHYPISVKEMETLAVFNAKILQMQAPKSRQ